MRDAISSHPQVKLNFIYPSPLIQEGTARLLYEMIITNYVPSAYTLSACC
jgi:hypothetical protein